MQPGKKTDSTNNSMELIILQERLRQSRHSFNAALAMTAASSVISLVGIAFLLTGQPALGVTMVAGGLGSAGSCIKLSKDANDRLDKLLVEFENEED